MGYDVRVLRGTDWVDDCEPIALDEWLREVEAAPDLTFAGTIEATTPAGETVSYSNEGLAMWTGHPSGASVPFDLRSGHIVAKNPDEATLDRLRALARSLDARVQGDEGEFYEEPAPPAPEAGPPRRRRFWRR